MLPDDSAIGIPLNDGESLIGILDEAQAMRNREVSLPSRSDTNVSTGLLSLVIHGTRSWRGTRVVLNGTSSSVADVRGAPEIYRNSSAGSSSRHRRCPWPKSNGAFRRRASSSRTIGRGLPREHGWHAGGESRPCCEDDRAGHSQ